MGFKIRDMWYNLGECFPQSDNATVIKEMLELIIQCPQIMQGEIRRQYVFHCPVSQCVVVFRATLLDLASVC